MTAPDSQLPFNLVEVFARLFAVRARRLEMRINPRQVLSGRFSPGWNRSMIMGCLDVEIMQVVRDLEIPMGMAIVGEVGNDEPKDLVELD